MNKHYISAAAALGALAVLAGAFGAHALKQQVNADTLHIYETGVRYQFYHVFALLATGMLARFYPGRALDVAGRCFIAGILLFSGSLYLMVGIRIFHGYFPPIVGLLTPIGGVLLIAGWISLFIGILRNKPLRNSP
ncbi:MAG TPA: DUF423 domain-containing protein [Chitinophagaceae bacterium]|nr:DUF423 domain-containing protein [Chitinophagaceae bacterium]